MIRNQAEPGEQHTAQPAHRGVDIRQKQHQNLRYSEQKEFAKKEQPLKAMTRYKNRDKF